MFAKQVAYVQLGAGKALGATVTGVQTVAHVPAATVHVVKAKRLTRRAFKASKTNLKQEMVAEGLTILVDTGEISVEEIAALAMPTVNINNQEVIPS